MMKKKKKSILFNRLGWMADSLKELINQHMNIYTLNLRKKLKRQGKAV